MTPTKFYALWTIRHGIVPTIVTTILLNWLTAIGSCHAAHVTGGETYMTSYSDTTSYAGVPTPAKSVNDSSTNVASAFRNISSENHHLYSHPAYGSEHTKTDGKASLFWNHAGRDDNAVSTPGSGHLWVSADSWASAGVGTSSGWNRSDSQSSSYATITQRYDAPVTVIVWYAVGTPTNDFLGYQTDSHAEVHGRVATAVTGSGAMVLDEVTTLKLTVGVGSRVYTLADALDNTADPTYDQEKASIDASFFWTVFEVGTEQPPPPGKSPDQPLPPVSASYFFEDNQDVPWTPFELPGELAWHIVIPANLDFGITEPVYSSAATQVNEGPNLGALVTGYHFVSDNNAFTSFVVPELPAETGSLVVTVGAETFPVVAGETIEFGEGVTTFALRGFDIEAANPADDAFVYGVTFADLGLASAMAVPMLYIPPGDFNKNGLVDAADYVAWRKGLATGSYTQDDYNLWRANFGGPLAGETVNISSVDSSAVPEPTTATIVFALAIPLTMCWNKRRLLSRR